MLGGEETGFGRFDCPPLSPRFLHEFSALVNPPFAAADHGQNSFRRPNETAPIGTIPKLGAHRQFPDAFRTSDATQRKATRPNTALAIPEKQSPRLIVSAQQAKVELKSPLIRVLLALLINLSHYLKNGCPARPRPSRHHRYQRPLQHGELLKSKTYFAKGRKPFSAPKKHPRLASGEVFSNL
jgi:hypothetical protein